MSHLTYKDVVLKKARIYHYTALTLLGHDAFLQRC